MTRKKRDTRPKIIKEEKFLVPNQQEGTCLMKRKMRNRVTLRQKRTKKRRKTDW